MLRFGPLKPEVTDLGDCDFDMLLYEEFGMGIIEKDLDSKSEATEKQKWMDWELEDFDTAIEILNRLQKNAERVAKKLNDRRTALVEAEERAKHEDLPLPGDILYIPSSDDVYGGQAVVKRIHFNLACGEDNRVFVSFEGIFEGGLTYALKHLLSEQQALKKMYGEEKARVRIW
jgi:hypothetical protein